MLLPQSTPSSSTKIYLTNDKVSQLRLHMNFDSNWHYLNTCNLHSSCSHVNDTDKPSLVLSVLRYALHNLIIWYILWYLKLEPCPSGEWNEKDDKSQCDTHEHKYLCTCYADVFIYSSNIKLQSCAYCDLYYLCCTTTHSHNREICTGREKIQVLKTDVVVNCTHYFVGKSILAWASLLLMPTCIRALCDMFLCSAPPLPNYELILYFEAQNNLGEPCLLSRLSLLSMVSVCHCPFPIELLDDCASQPLPVSLSFKTYTKCEGIKAMMWLSVNLWRILVLTTPSATT